MRIDRILGMLSGFVSSSALAVEPESSETLHPEHDAQTPATDEGLEHGPVLPDGQTLEQVLQDAQHSTLPGGVKPVRDQKVYAFWLFDQAELRPSSDGSIPVGWESLGWVGGDRDRLWWKNEGEWAPFAGLAGETEADVLYGRLVSPFWTVQAGVRYGAEWSTDGYEDRWAGAVALQGLVPFKVELDASVYLDETLLLSSEIEAEYGLRITQRLVVSPRLGVNLAAQDRAERNIGWGVTSATTDLRIRYEIRREFAPYLGVRGDYDVGRTAALVREDDGTPVRVVALGGARFAF